MSKNKLIIKDIIENLKYSNDKKKYLEKIKNDYDYIFSNNKINEIYFNSLSSYESLEENKDKVTPEILSFLDELMLSLDNGQYESGSYYTNKILINNILSENKSLDEKTVIDPAAGTGNFLINVILNIIPKLKTKNDFVNYIEKYIYMNEIQIDSINIYIKRLNYISINFFNEKLNISDINIIKKNCFNKDFLTDFNFDIKFDIIIGNPPYLGTKSLGRNYLDKLVKEFGFSDDLYSMFIFKSFSYLNKKHFFSFVTSNTYFTLRTKEYIREKMVKNGLYKIINHNKKHFNIMSNTSVFFINDSFDNDKIEIYNELENFDIVKTNELNKKKIKEINYKFSLNKNKETEISNLFQKSITIYNKYKEYLSTSSKIKKFKETDLFIEIIKENDVLPLGFIAFIATGVDFKGKNKEILYSLTNNKFNLIENESEIKYNLTINDFNNGLSEHKYIKAIKGKEYLFVKWNKKTFEYLKEIKAPLRNLSLYGEPIIYCKTSTYELFKIDKNTLCINTAGACFIKPIIDLSIDEIFNQINKEEIKDYIKNNINNSLCFTPNDLKLIPIKIR